jgi:hypothetical protein
MFYDRARIYVKGGDGGNGAISFRREKYVPRGDLMAATGARRRRTKRERLARKLGLAEQLESS